MKIKLTGEQVMAIRAFLQSQKFTKEQWQESYHSWAKGGNGWNVLQSGGTNIHQALTWYQHIHRPGSKEWRPPVIARALVEAVNKQSEAQ